MKVLVACEFSGTVRDAFIRAGHDVNTLGRTIKAMCLK
jgi:hypothetical protein